MRIRFIKLTDREHALEVVHGDGRTERVVCETRSLLIHDLLHLAVESEARLTHGFWGQLAAGTTLEEMNDRTKPAAPSATELLAIERLVGALHGATKQRPPSELIAGLRRYADALDTELPEWLTEELVIRVEERIRQLSGQWRATPYGGTLEVIWSAEAA